ncbi:MAG: glycine--tRNA ligase subunit beta [Anaerolineaceae bacterium]|nr:glycine--tRNA ligase subunit beta [Anaerolineaceae bacterium]
MRNPLNFQSIMLSLEQFWAEKGCLIWQPYYSQVGAGTMNPATFLRVLGPEPWNVAYVEPSVRPDDGRYGDNPYRLQQHYQFQVILKPDPGNPQELYLQSLQALGIDPLEHDIRFVEDNWESPALGAWGLGWEVWLDGQEITQFTYFQQAGGFNLEPVSVEITYGLERIAMALQGCYDFRKIQWSPDYTYGDVNYQAEKEHSQYYFETADIERVREMYRLYEEEANLALEKGLVLPAYDYILKCSHNFNILDTRGAVGVTERQALFGRMRDLSRRTAEAYIAQRETLGFPWLEKLAAKTGQAANESPQMSLPTAEKSEKPSDFLLEIGTEELPASDLESALQQLEQLVPAMLTDLRLEHGDVKVFGTPRRLVVWVESLAARQEDLTQKMKGPPADRAFDKNGNPTPAANGFARGKGVDVKNLKKEEIDGGVYLMAEVHLPGKSVYETLPEKLTNLVAAIRFDKSMRWNASGVTFSRPIRWLVSLFGSQAIPFEYANLTAGYETRGLRFSENEAFSLKDSGEYFEFLNSQNILANSQERMDEIASQVAHLQTSIKASPELDGSLLNEVTNLVEAPTALLGNFNKNHLTLPPEVLVGVMKKHQRYFPVRDAQGKLMAHFITVRNGGNQHLDIVAHGNEEVIEARFADAAFFMREDSKHTIDDFIQRLDTLVFHPKLGSMLAKTERIVKLTTILAEQLALSPEDKTAALEAAHFCKADLVTKMVVEMTALQGVIGRYYALKSGKSALAAQAIEEHYYPRYAGDASPASIPGMAVGLADRLDSLAGLFSVGMAPSGTKDPFGLRRTAIGLVQNLIAKGVSLDLRESLKAAASLLPAQPKPEVQQACMEFITSRFENMLLEEGYRHDVVKAVLAEQAHNPAAAVAAITELTDWTARKDWGEVLPAYARCVRITRDLKETFTIDLNSLTEVQEKDLNNAFEKVKKMISSDSSMNTFLAGFVEMIPAINTFFNTILVMDTDQKVRENRLALLQGIASLAKCRADFSKLEGF